VNNLLLVLAIALTAGLLTGTAYADDKETARQAYLEGTKRYDLNEFAPALEAFKRAYLSYEDPAFLFNIAQCYRQLGDKTSAVKFYRSYLRKVPDASNRDEVNATISNLDAAIAADKAQPPPSPVTSAPTRDAVAAPASSPALVTASPAPRRVPAYKKWWVWTIVGVVAAGAAAGVAVAVTSQRTENAFMPVMVKQ
jgi:tetratricopeptide (TPR) repeat protein